MSMNVAPQRKPMQALVTLKDGQGAKDGKIDVGQVQDIKIDMAGAGKPKGAEGKQAQGAGEKGQGNIANRSDDAGTKAAEAKFSSGNATNPNELPKKPEERVPMNFNA